MNKRSYIFPICIVTAFIFIVFIRITTYFLPSATANLLFSYIFVPLSYLLCAFIWAKIPIWQLDRRSSIIFFLGLITIFAVGSLHDITIYQEVCFKIGVFLIFVLSISELLLAIFYLNTKKKFKNFSDDLIKLTRNPDKYSSWLKIIFAESIFLFVVAISFLVRIK